MTLTRQQKQLLVEVHPDRHGGDHSRMERVFAAMKRPSQAMSAVRRCRVCGVRIGGVKTCRMHQWATMLLSCLVMVAGYQAPALDVTLAWDASPSTGVTNYVLYVSSHPLTENNLYTADVAISVGTNLTTTVTNLNAITYFVATAQADGVESSPSNLVEWSPDGTVRVGTLRIGP
jgi:hypothetical protein